MVHESGQTEQFLRAIDVMFESSAGTAVWSRYRNHHGLGEEVALAYTVRKLMSHPRWRWAGLTAALAQSGQTQQTLQRVCKMQQQDALANLVASVIREDGSFDHGEFCRNWRTIHERNPDLTNTQMALKLVELQCRNDPAAARQRLLDHLCGKPYVIPDDFSELHETPLYLAKSFKAGFTAVRTGTWRTLEDPLIGRKLTWRDKLENLTEGRSFARETMSVFQAAMASRNATKTMTAMDLLAHRADTRLEKLVDQLMYWLGENEMWFKYAMHMGAVTGEAAERRIREARVTGKPESIVVPEIAAVSGYLATTFLDDLKAIGDDNVVLWVSRIEEHLASRDSVAQSKSDDAARVNTEVRAFIIQNELCDTDNATQVQARLDALKRFKVKCLADLPFLTVDDWRKECGFEGLYAVKAHAAAKRLAK